MSKSDRPRSPPHLESFISERKDAKQQTVEDIGSSDRVAYQPFAIYLYFHIGDLGGGYGVGGRDVRRTDNAADRDDLLFGVDLKTLVAFDEKQTAGQYFDHSCGKSG